MSDKRVSRASGVAWIRVSEIHVAPYAQRKYRIHMAESIATNFDPDKLGILVVSLRGGRYWVVDGQHRVGALKIIGYDDQLIECQVYDGLDEKAEAEMFLGLNTKLSVSVMDKFLVSLAAQRPRELDIARSVEREGLTVGFNKGQIGAVSALGKVYDIAGPDRLSAALRMIRDAYGDSGMRADLIEGMGLVMHRYNGQIKEGRAIEKLSSARGGMNGLVTKAEVLRRQVGRPKAHCVAAAVVETINSGRGGNKLPDWWS